MASLMPLTSATAHCARDVTLHYDSNRPPLSALALAHVVTNPASATPSHVTLAPSQSSSQSQPKLTFADSKDELVGSVQILRYLARVLLANPSLSSLPSVTNHLYGENALESTQVDHLLSFSHSLTSKESLIANATLLDEQLKYRTFLIGHFLTIADLACFDALRSNQRWAVFTKPGQSSASLAAFPSLARWVRHVQSLPLVAAVMSIKSQAHEAKAAAKLAASASGAGFDNVDLGDTSAVVTRFPPEPSGYLHIGHLKAALLNDIMAKKFNGKLILRFDDTNPKKEKEEYVESILEDLKLVGVKWDVLTHTSDHFDYIQSMCEKMISQDKAYVDATPVEDMRDQRGKGQPNQYRQQSVEENLRLWREMLAGTAEGKKCAVRAKIDIAHNNYTMRDPTIYRCNELPHHRTGTKYKAYPTYDFACPIVDSIEGVTHTFRTNEYRDRNEQYYWMIDALGLRKPLIRDFSRVNFVYTTLSKRKLTWFVDSKKVMGWDDPRFPTIRGILRRGMTVEALREFMIGQGFSIGSNMMEYDKIWTINKRIIDPKARRFTAIASDRAVKLTVSGLVGNSDGFDVVSVPSHPKNADMGVKTVTQSNSLLLEYEDAVTLKQDEEVTLMTIGNAIIDSIAITDTDAVVTSHFILNGDFKKTDKKLTWLDNHSANQRDLVRLTLVELDALITVAKVEEDTNFESIVNDNTWLETSAIGEAAMRTVQKGEIIQLNRRGYFIADSVDLQSPKGLVLIAIPDGRAKNVSVLGSKVDKAKMAGKKKERAPAAAANGDKAAANP